MKKKRQGQNNASYITKIFVRIFLIFTALNVIVISGVVAFSSLQIRESEGASLIASVGEAAKNGNINWKEFELIGEDGHWSDYVQVTRASGKIDESHGTSEFLKAPSFHFDHFSVSNGNIFWNSALTSNGSRIELWLNVTDVLKMVLRTILSIIAIMLVVFVIAFIVIRYAAKQISQPIEDLALAVESGEATELEVPDFPIEVGKLARSFNRLLRRLNVKILQEQQFVSDASHELRTPVAAIRGHAILLKRRWREHPEIVDASIAYIDEESQRMKIMIEELLTLSRGNHMEMKKETVNLSELTKRMIKEIQPSLMQKIEFIGKEQVIIDTDKDIVHRILVTFLENAGKYAPESSEIKVQLKWTGESLDLSVADEGAGIPEEEKNKIFERFYRIDKSRSSEIPGTGLGLAIAKQYAEMVDAWVFVSDNLPHGSIFHLVFQNDCLNKEDKK